MLKSIVFSLFLFPLSAHSENLYLASSGILTVDFLNPQLILESLRKSLVIQDGNLVDLWLRKSNESYCDILSLREFPSGPYTLEYTYHGPSPSRDEGYLTISTSYSINDGMGDDLFSPFDIECTVYSNDISILNHHMRGFFSLKIDK